MNRNEIKEKIQGNLERIQALMLENENLHKESLLISDGHQQFKEEIEYHPKRKYQRKQNPLDGKLVGRIYWRDHFIDEDTGEKFTLDRSQVVRIDGKWVCD